MVIKLTSYQSQHDASRKWYNGDMGDLETGAVRDTHAGASASIQEPLNLSQDRFVISSNTPADQMRGLLNKKLILQGSPIDMEGRPFTHREDLSESKLEELKKNR